jgi:hypothetical protein
LNSCKKFYNGYKSNSSFEMMMATLNSTKIIFFKSKTK